MEDTISREEEVRAFDATKIGVKGLIDQGITKVPRIFHTQIINDHHHHHNTKLKSKIHQVPVIDFNCPNRDELVKQIKEAGEKWGFFQMVNHGIPVEVSDEMLDGVRRFHEMSNDVKMKMYSREMARPVKFYSNGYLNPAKAVNWRDTVGFEFSDGQLDLELVPSVCREALSEYMKYLMELKDKLSELLSEALGLESDYLLKLECMESPYLSCSYYPPCPEPNLTIGASRHSDPCFLTILLQDNVGGLQILHRDEWVDVLPVHGALIANVGDMIQLITNDKFKSVEHRVLAHKGPGPRVSAACFFNPSKKNKSSKMYEPIEKLLSNENSIIYKGAYYDEYLAFAGSNGFEGALALPKYKM